MLIAVICLGFLCAVLVVTNVITVQRSLALQDTLNTAADQTEESLDILDGCYGRLSRLAATPVLYDDPIVKEVIFEMKTAKEAVLLVANKMVVFSEKEDEE